MSPRPAGRSNPCTVTDARARLNDAEAFFEAASLTSNPDVKATNAIHSAIASSDAICCVALRERSSDGNHAAAIQLVARVDQRLSAALRRALDRKAQAAYEARDIAASDAEMCLRQASILLEAARERILAI